MGGCGYGAYITAQEALRIHIFTRAAGILYWGGRGPFICLFTCPVHSFIQLSHSGAGAFTLESIVHRTIS